jgi:hypothetical protein
MEIFKFLVFNTGYNLILYAYTVLACHRLLAVGKHVNKGIEIEITFLAPTGTWGIHETFCFTSVS